MNMNDFARMGAQTRLAELAAEVDSIRRMFPDLGSSRSTKRGRPARDNGADRKASPEAPARKRKPMSAAAKKAVGERMRRYWAERRQTQGAPATDLAAETSVRTHAKADSEAPASTTQKPGKPKGKRGKLSAAGRAAISAAQKKRWALKRSAAKKRAGKKR